MKTKMNIEQKVKNMEMADIFEVTMVGGHKMVNRWGFFVDQGDGTYAVYKPQKPTCKASELFMIEEDEPGPILIVSANEVNEFIGSKNIQGIAAMEVSDFTACGWYYDTIV